MNFSNYAPRGKGQNAFYSKVKLTTLFMLIACLQVSAKPIAQRISISVHNSSLEKLFTEIEKKTNYVFFYDIQGIVFSGNGSPLAGASVFIKKLNRLTVTNERGEFALNNIPDGAYTVDVSYIGFEKNSTSISVVAHQAKMEVTMKPANNNLDETVVIPYATTTKRLNTGNLAKIKAEEIERQPLTNRFKALETRMRERLVTLIIPVRGKGIIVINFNRHSGNPLNPLDIKSIRIIKDADPITPYGIMTL
jgi:hypothetical protein